MVALVDREVAAGIGDLFAHIILQSEDLGRLCTLVGRGGERLLIAVVDDVVACGTVIGICDGGESDGQVGISRLCRYVLNLRGSLGGITVKRTSSIEVPGTEDALKSGIVLIDVRRAECREEATLTVGIREAGTAVLGDDQSGHATGMRTGHRGPLHEFVVTPSSEDCSLVVHLLLHGGAVDLSTGVVKVTTGAHQLDPLATIGVVRLLPVGSHSGDGHHRTVSGRVGHIIGGLITGSKEYHPTLHRGVGQLIAIGIAAGKVDEVVDCRLERGGHKLGSAPGILRNDGTVIGSVDKGALKGLPILSPKGIADHDPHACVGATVTTCDTGDADTVVIHRSDHARHVCTVGVISDIGILVGKVVPVDIVLVLALTGMGVDPDILSQVLMLIVDTTIDDSHDDGGISGLLLPRLEEVEISALERLESRSRIVVVPLLREVGVVEGHHILLVTL